MKFYYLLGILTLILNSKFILAQELIFEKKVEENSAMFYLIDNNIVIDSIEVENVDYYYTWLEQVNDSLYHFVYEKITETTNEVNREQLLILKKNKKLEVAFVGLQESTHFPYSPLVPNGGRVFWSFKHDLFFDNLSKGAITLICTEILTQELESIIRDTLYLKYELLFDEQNNVFFNEMDTLNGYYDFCIIKNNEKIGFKEVHINQIVPSIHIKTYRYSFMDGSWYFFSDLNTIYKSVVKEIIPKELDNITERPKSLYKGWELIKETKKVEKEKKVRE